MAKKTKKKKLKTIKTTSKNRVKKKTPLLKTIIVSALIFTAAIAVAAIVSVVRYNTLSKKPAYSKTTAESITIKDTENNREYKLPISPASASITSLSTPGPGSAQTTDNAPHINKTALFSEAKSKQEILKISIAEAKLLYDSGRAVFLDARGDPAYNSAHIKGAYSMPLGTAHIKMKELAPVLKNKVLVPYCSGAGCHLSDKLAHKLYDAGYKKVVIFFGGWSQWQQEKLPVETKKQ